MGDPQSHLTAWDAFIDALDRAGQAGSAASVEVPAVAGELAAGKRFGELTRLEVKHLARIANSLGRRADVVVVMWQDLQWKIKQQKKAEQKQRKNAASS
jgi:hypothetical protein